MPERTQRESLLADQVETKEELIELSDAGKGTQEEEKVCVLGEADLGVEDKIELYWEVVWTWS